VVVVKGVIDREAMLSVSCEAGGGGAGRYDGMPMCM